MPNPYVTPRTFAFLKQLAAHNDRDWFNANKQRYTEEVRACKLKRKPFTGGLVTNFYRSELEIRR